MNIIIQVYGTLHLEIAKWNKLLAHDDC